MIILNKKIYLTVENLFFAFFILICSVRKKRFFFVKMKIDAQNKLFQKISHKK
jgi:hypothetical protein